MKKLIALLFLMPFLCFGQGAHRISQVIIKGNGISANVSPGSKVLVCVINTGCATAANIYLDSALTTLAPNPLTADGSGNYDYYISSGCVDEQISAPGQGTLFVPNVCPFNGQSGGGGNPAPPQYAVQFAGPSAAAFNADGTFTFTPSTHALAALLTNGSYNTDVAQSGGGNNGLGNLEAGACAGGGCVATFPATSTSTESRIPTVSNTVVQDYKGGGVGNYFYNPSPLGAGGGYHPGGAASAVGVENLFNFDTEQLLSGVQQQIGFKEDYNFNAPGWSWGSNTGETGFALWSTQHAHTFTMTTSTPGISQYNSGNCYKYSVGDSACAGYFYNRADASFTSPADEGTDGLGVQVVQNSSWFHGTAAAGATTGTQALPTTFVSGTNSRAAYSVGGYMLDFSRALIVYGNVTGVATQMPNSGPWSFPVSPAVTESTAWGYANAAIPTPVDPTTASTDTVAFTVTGGTNAGGYTTGTAWLDGAVHMEQVMITAVGAISGGVQSVTFTHRYPNPQTGTYMFQGGTNGFYSSDIISFGTLYGGWRTAYPVFGAIDSSHLVGRFASVSNYPIPSFYNASTTNVLLTNLSVSGTTVTANIGSQLAHYFDGLESAVISNATNSAYNGTVTNIKVINDYQLQWTQTVTGTSASAYISYPASYYQFNLLPGAEVIQPPATATPTVVPLEPNNVAWGVGDTLQNVQQASFRGAIITGNMQVFSPDSQNQGGIGGFGYGLSGAGISGQYNIFSVNNQNSPTMYQGGGGLLQVERGIVLQGPVGSALTTTAPLDHSAVIVVGCSLVDGCNTTNSTPLININGAGMMSYYPATNQFYLNSITTPKIQASILSTGDGRYVNNGYQGGAPVALTAASELNNGQGAALGNYGAFGNETVMDTSADIAAHTIYGGTLYAGAKPPTGIGVVVNGTTGSSTYSYVAISNTQNGGSVQSGTITTTTGNATLSATNNNAPQFLMGKGAQSTDVYRTAAPGGYGLGRICTAVDNVSLRGNGDAPCLDTGQATTGSLPANVDTSGNIQSAAATIGALTVTSVSGTGTDTFTLGSPSVVGSGATTPTCISTTCDSISGVVGFTTGTGTGAGGPTISVNLPNTRGLNFACIAQSQTSSVTVTSCIATGSLLAITTSVLPASSPVAFTYFVPGR